MVGLCGLQSKSKCCFDLIPRNKFCFTGGYIEASIQLPSANNVYGLWPAIWTMGIRDVRVMVLVLSKEWYVQRNIILPHLLRFGPDSSGLIRMMPVISVPWGNNLVPGCNPRDL